MITLSVPPLLDTVLGKAMQMSYVVADMEEAMRFWSEELKAGPFVVIEQAADDRIVSYRGRRTRVKMRLAFTYVGNIQIELISAACPDPTPWTDFLSSGREGLHHLGFWPDDYEEACSILTKLGFTPECTIETENGATSANYFGSPPHMGIMVELAPNTPARNRYFGGIKALSENWDGSRPIRSYKTREHYLASMES
jgi:hypothetical protein